MGIFIIIKSNVRKHIPKLQVFGKIMPSKSPPNICYPCQFMEGLGYSSFVPQSWSLLKTLGARSCKRQPWIHRSVQNNVFSPLPTEVTTEIANIANVCICTGISQGRFGLVFSIQSHLICRAHPITSRLWMPNPPNSSGHMTFSQATRQHPPFASFLPSYKKPLLILSIAWMNHLGTLRDTNK